MEVDSDWNIENCRNEYESDEHWQLRRDFIIANKNKFPEAKLLCLAQVFVNVELLGCKYPLETMKLVEELSQGVAESFRGKRKNRLQRIFVPASQAASEKVKRSNPKESKILANQIKFMSALEKTFDEKMDLDISAKPKLNRKNVRKIKQPQETPSSNINLPPCPYGKIILIEPADRLINPVQTINRSMHLCHIKPTFNTIPGLEGKQCDLYLDDKLLASATEYSVKAAKEAAARFGIDKLKETCYTIKIKHKFLADSTIDKSFQSTFEEEKSTLGDNNIGNKLLRLMGWTGGGLGKTQQGIHEPVQVQEHVNRVGLGLSSKQISLENPRKFRAMIHKVINNFLQKETVQDLVFSEEFTGEERKEMHNIIRRYDLKTKSYGKETNRKLVVSKKVNFFDVVESLLQTGGSNEKYELEKPNGL